MKRTLRRAVAEEHDRWGVALAAQAVTDEALRQRRHAKGRHESLTKGAPCVAVWPVDPLPEVYADRMLRVLGDMLDQPRPWCACGLGSGMMPIALAAWPGATYCTWCIREVERSPFSHNSCDGCLVPTEELWAVLAYAGPCLVVAWLCWDCSECEPW